MQPAGTKSAVSASSCSSCSASAAVRGSPIGTRPNRIASVPWPFRVSMLWLFTRVGGRRGVQGSEFGADQTIPVALEEDAPAERRVEPLGEVVAEVRAPRLLADDRRGRDERRDGEHVRQL